MSLTPYFFNRGFGPSSYLDPFSSPFDDLFDPFSAVTTPSFGGLSTGGGGQSLLQHPIHDLENMALSPVMDVRDQGDKYQVVCKPPPNYNQNDLHVRVDRDILSVNGQHSETEESGTSKRQSRQSFTRLIRLPDSVDQQQIIARWTDEGLSINLPKKAGALESGRKIQIEGIESGSSLGGSGGGGAGGGGGGESLSTSSSSFSSTTPSSSSGDFRTVGGIGGGSASPMQKGSAMQSSAIEAEPNK